ncbi:MAG: THUMP domain-containing protein [Candidatus Undinarchaeales archaeon]|jgi:thiamine biosynthesis protein ThiI|nr:THUMP domain-containing protein [Candidatus Undinarchaeales archaeon]
MKFDTILVRYGEIGLKSPQTRRIFENKFMENIKGLLNKHVIDFEDIKTEWGRVYINTTDENALKLLRTIFGTATFSPAASCSADMKEISKLSLVVAKSKIKKEDTFAVRVSRQGIHDFKSRDIKKQIGSDIKKATEAGVDLDKPNREVFVEVRNKKAYVFVEKIPGPGGIPQGIEGKVLGIFDEKKPYQVAAYLMAKRGCEIEAVASKELDLGNLKHWLGDFKVHIVDSKDLYKETERIAKEQKIKAIFTADGLNELQDFKKIKINVPIFRPLIGLDERKIKIVEQSING